MLKLTKESTRQEICAYIAAYIALATKVYSNKKLAIAFTYNMNGETFVKVVSVPFSVLCADYVSIDEKSNSSRHVSADTEKTYKLRLTNLKNKGESGKSFIKEYGFTSETLLEMTFADFISGYEQFTEQYAECANSVIYAQRAKQKRQKKAQNTQMTLTIGHYIESLLTNDWSINCITVRNGYDVKINNVPYEVKSCLGKIKYNGENYSFGGSSIELTKDN